MSINRVRLLTHLIVLFVVYTMYSSRHLFCVQSQCGRVLEFILFIRVI